MGKQKLHEITVACNKLINEYYTTVLYCMSCIGGNFHVESIFANFASVKKVAKVFSCNKLSNKKAIISKLQIRKNRFP